MKQYTHLADQSNIPICRILGVPIAAIDMEWLLAYTEEHFTKLSGDYLCAANVHTTVTAFEDPLYMEAQRGAVMCIPDGGPLSSLGRKRGFPRMKRVTGPSYMNEILARSASRGYRHFFYGSTEETLAGIREVLTAMYPDLKIAGMYSPPFRPLTAEEDEAVIQRINEAAADFVWVGLGAPKQELWMAEHRGKINGFMVGVGAGFDYLAGNIKRAPKWMQRCNLEWLFRLFQDPVRLFYRYLHTNLSFIWNAVIRGR